MTTYGGTQRKTRAYNRTAPRKYDYWAALHYRGINYRLDTPITALKARCEQEGITVTKGEL